MIAKYMKKVQEIMKNNDEFRKANAARHLGGIYWAPPDKRRRSVMLEDQFIVSIMTVVFHVGMQEISL